MSRTFSTIILSGHSRIPIFEKNPDDIVGFVHVRDMLKEMEGGAKVVTLAQIARDPVFASQEKTVAALLKEMKGRKVHMAIVIDEHGGVEGLVTLEDLLEEIVGEIEDESDKTPKVQYTRLDDDTIIVKSLNTHEILPVSTKSETNFFSVSW